MIKNLFIIFYLFTFVSCQTTARWFESEPKDASIKPSTSLDQDDLAELKPLILSLQIQYGIFPTQERLYSLIHNVHCYKDGALQACFLRLVLEDSPYLSEPEQLSRHLSEKLLRGFYSQSKSLRSERQIFADLVCDHINEAMPPFDKSIEFCRPNDPRRLDEFYIRNDRAVALTSWVLNVRKSPKSSEPLSITCNVQDTFSCLLMNEEDETKSVGLPDVLGGYLAQRFNIHYRQRWAVRSSKNKQDLLKINDIQGRLNCSVPSNMIKKEQVCVVNF